MDTRELEELDLGIELAINKQEQAAHFIFARLRESNPDNSPLLALLAHTATDPAEAEAALETAIKLDPANPLLPKTRRWLETHKLKTLKTPVSTTNTVTIPTQLKDSIASTLAVSNPTLEETVKPAPKTQAKVVFVPFSAVWWVRLVCSLVFFGAAMMLLFLFATANNLTRSEKAYFDRIS